MSKFIEVYILAESELENQYASLGIEMDSADVLLKWSIRPEDIESFHEAKGKTNVTTKSGFEATVDMSYEDFKKLIE